MEIRRVALIDNDRPRPETSGFYCRRAWESLVEVTHFRPDDLAAIPRGEFDLHLNVDDGLVYDLPADLRPCAWWAIDTHLGFGRCLAKARGSEVVFAARRDGAEQLRRAGIVSAAWLPLACDPDIHCKHDVPKRYDAAFVGHIFPGLRTELLEMIRRRYPRSFIGNAYFEEMARTYSAARTAFNRSIRNDVNMRVFEAVACGSMLLTNELDDNGLPEIFRDGVHLATYRGPEDMLDKLAFYLARDELRERIATAGRAEAIEKHTYRHRMERLLHGAEEALGRLSLGGVSIGHDAASGADREDGTSPARRDRADVPHDPFYFGHARPEVGELVPRAARTVLDIGCGAGRLGEAIKARQAARVVGIELDEAAAAVARRHLDDVLEALRVRCQFLFEHGTPDEAERALKDLLGYALKDSGRTREAVAAWEQVLRLAPGASSAREELRRVANPGSQVPFARMA